MDPSTFQAPPIATLSNPPARAPAPKCPRLKGAALQILEEWVRSHGIGLEPTKEERKVLLKQIRAIPGYNAYTSPNLKSWFTRRREPRNTHENDEASSSRYPHLTAEAIRGMETVFRTTQEPDDELVRQVAAWVKVPVAEVRAWLQERKNPDGSSSATQWRPPTPRNTTSPEPLSPAESYDMLVDKADPLFSPTISPATALPQHVPECAWNSDENPSDSIRHFLLRAIAESDLDADAVPLSATTNPPTNAEQYNQMFERYSKIFLKLETLLDCYLPPS